MNQPIDIAELLKSIGIRLSKEVLRALLDDMHKRKASPAQVCELLVAAEARERARRNVTVHAPGAGSRLGPTPPLSLAATASAMKAKKLRPCFRQLMTMVLVRSMK